MLQQLGRYRITGQLGAGGMGVVYLAEDTVLGRRVALKTVRLLEGSGPTSHNELAERFLREARIVAQMDHPGIVSVYDFGYEGETAYLVLEYVAGTNLSQRLDQGPKLERTEAARVLREAASALDYAHGRGVVHRDVKPANLLLTGDGRVKVADFGIAKLSGSTTMTATGMLMGTVEYMSPEQIRGENVDGRSDQFALGVVAYQLITGKRPFQADSAISLAHMIVYEQPAPPSGANQGGMTLPPVDAVLARALDKKPAARYPTCAEFVRELEQCWVGGAAPVPHVAANVSPATVETAPMNVTPARPATPLPVASAPQPAPAPPPLPAPAAPARVSKWIWALVVFVVLGGTGTFFLVKQGLKVLRDVTPESTPSEASSKPPVIPPKTPPQSVPQETPKEPSKTEAVATPPPAPVHKDVSAPAQKAERDDTIDSAAGERMTLPALQKRAAEGDVRAMLHLGNALENGRGGPRDYVAARRWYEKAAAKGQRAAMDRLGEMYYDGLGVPKDYAAAKEWYEKAAQRNFPPAYLHLGRLYRNGDGVSQDCTVARTWYEEAAAANNNTAMMMLGELYDEGCHGFRHDKDLARQWYSKAAEAGNEQAKEKLHALK